MHVLSSQSSYMITSYWLTGPPERVQTRVKTVFRPLQPRSDRLKIFMRDFYLYARKHQNMPFRDPQLQRDLGLA
jgi:hypothetical protein